MSQWYRQKGLFTKAVLPLLIFIPLGIAAVISFVSGIAKKNAISQARTSAAATIDQFRTLREYYTETVVNKVAGIRDLRVDLDHGSKSDTIPPSATMTHELSEEFLQGSSGLKVRLYSDLPFANRKARVLDEFEKEAIVALKERPYETFSRFYGEKGNERLRIAVADKLVANSCVQCHNSHPQSPFRQWKLGDVRGVLEIETPLAVQMATTRQAAMQLAFAIAMTGALMIGFVFFVIRGYFLRPIREIADSLREAAGQTLNKSSGIREISESVSLGTLNQAAAITESSGSLQEIEALITHSSEATRLTADLSQRSQDDMNHGRASLTEMLGAIRNIKEVNATIHEQISSFRDRSSEIIRVINEIASKTGVINDIVFQTKLLSFNASVEAARAGDAGRGFAVVAEEVGSLAQMSGRASKEITSMVRSSIETVQAMVEEMQSRVDGTMSEGEKRVVAGIQIAERCEQVLGKVAANAKEIDQAMMSLRVVADEQGYGVSRVKETMLNLDQKNHETHEAAGLALQYAQEMNRQAAELTEIVGRLETILAGKGWSAQSKAS